MAFAALLHIAMVWEWLLAAFLSISKGNTTLPATFVDQLVMVNETVEIGGNETQVNALVLTVPEKIGFCYDPYFIIKNMATDTIHALAWVAICVVITAIARRVLQYMLTPESEPQDVVVARHEPRNQIIIHGRNGAPVHVFPGPVYINLDFGSLPTAMRNHLLTNYD
jgi:hypothetical protein